MTIYQFSALSDGQAISFDATADRLNFDQTTIAAGDLTFAQEGADLRVLVKSGPVQGKDIVLVSTDPTEIATSNFTFADGSLALVGDNQPVNNTDHLGNVLNGGAGRDLLMGLGGNDTMNGGDNSDSLVGSLGNDAINGNNGNDWLEGGEGTDTLTGSGGQDTFIFREAGSANADTLPDFASNWDRIELDAAFLAVGAAGRFTAGDVRFFAGAAAHDADDRIIFNGATGQIFYDPDGNGAQAQQLLATLGAGRGVVASDFTVIGSGSGTGGTINGTNGDDTLIGTPGPDTINGLGGNDSIRGGEGADSMNGGDGNDTLDGYDHRTFDVDTNVETLVGGLGNDVFKVDNSSDVVSDTGGIDTVFAGNISWTLASGFENLVLDNDESFQIGRGNELDNMIGQLDHGWNMQLEGLGGNDTLLGGFQEDTLLGGDGNDSMDGAEGVDSLDGGAGNDTLNSTILGGDDDMSGGLGADHFYVAPYGNSANRIHDFETGVDKLRLDGNNMANTGASGNFAANDPRFFAGTSAHDADDRVIWDGTALWYDPDGTGSATQQRVAMVTGSVVATDIEVVNGSGGAGNTIEGTPGNDSLVGGSGNDTINGNGGSDTMVGNAGDDSLFGGGDPGDAPDRFVGGDGNDTLDGWVPHGSTGADTMDGGAGDDLYIVDHPGDLLTDSSGVDTVRALDLNWTLAAGFENLIVDNQVSEGFRTGVGNAAGNQMSVLWGGRLEGLGGNDTLTGTDRSDQLIGGDGNDVLNGTLFDLRTDTLNGGAGNDTLTGKGVFVFDVAPGGANADLITSFTTGTDTIELDGGVFSGIGFTGRFAAGDARFFAASGANAGHDADDRVVYNTSTGQLWYDADGSGSASAQLIATLQGAPTVAATDINVANAPGLVINGTSGNDSLVGTTSDDTINGFGGNDTIDGNLGADSMVGGTGDDLYFVDNAGDQVVEASNAGIDEVRTAINYTLTDFVNNLTMTGNGIGHGNAIDNVIRASASGNRLFGGDGNDTLIGGAGANWLEGENGNDSLVGGGVADQLLGGAGNDTVSGGAGDDNITEFAGGGNWGSDVIDGGAGRDWLLFDSLQTQGVNVNLAAGTLTSALGNATLSNIENVEATNGNDLLVGDAGNNTLIGFHGEDTFDGGLGNDTIDQSTSEPEGFADRILFTVAPGAANADTIFQWENGIDQIHLDAAVMAALGASGQFSAGDARFFAGAGVNAGHDADDRVVYNTSSGQLWYDADGSGAGAAQLLFTIAGARPVSATDIWVDNGSGGGGGGTINGTPGNDSLTGTAGNDTINGNAGNDTLRGLAGDDSLDGGSGTDLLDGGLGNDIYVVSSGDSLTDAGGTDLIFTPVSWSMAGAFENLEITGTGSGITVSGNFMSNVITGNDGANIIRARDGNDTLTGNGGADFFDFTTAPSASNADTITDFTHGVDRLRFEDAAHTGIGATGNWSATDGRFFAGAGATGGHDANDRVVYDTNTGNLYYDADGSGSGAAQLVATLQGAPTVTATDITVI